MRIQYYISSGDGGGHRVTSAPARADGFHILTDDEDQGFRTEGDCGVAGPQRRSPNLAVVSETLHVLIDRDGHRPMYRAQHVGQEQEQP